MQDSRKDVSNLEVTQVEEVVKSTGVNVDSTLAVRTLQNPIVDKIVAELTNDPKFLSRVEESVKKMLQDGKLDSSDVPELVFLIMDTYNNVGNVRVSKELLEEFVKQVFKFIVEKYKLLPQDKMAEYESMIVSSVKLVLLTPSVDSVLKSFGEKLKKFFKCW
jgi:Glu-tRNA(Gln) amidotransferase subunit E-like FAD-binding protein